MLKEWENRIKELVEHRKSLSWKQYIDYDEIIINGVLRLSMKLVSDDFRSNSEIESSEDLPKTPELLLELRVRPSIESIANKSKESTPEKDKSKKGGNKTKTETQKTDLTDSISPSQATYTDLELSLKLLDILRECFEEYTLEALTSFKESPHFAHLPRKGFAKAYEDYTDLKYDPYDLNLTPHKGRWKLPVHVIISTCYHVLLAYHGEKLLNEENVVEAEECFQKIVDFREYLEKHYNFPFRQNIRTEYYNLSACQKKLGKVSEAIKSLCSYVSYYPDDTSALGDLFSLMGALASNRKKESDLLVATLEKSKIENLRRIGVIYRLFNVLPLKRCLDEVRNLKTNNNLTNGQRKLLNSIVVVELLERERVDLVWAQEEYRYYTAPHFKIA